MELLSTLMHKLDEERRQQWQRIWDEKVLQPFLDRLVAEGVLPEGTRIVREEEVKRAQS
jgi:hypothetical protein